MITLCQAEACGRQIKHTQVAVAFLIGILVLVAQSKVQREFRAETNLVLCIEAVIVVLQTDPAVALGKLCRTHIHRKTQQQVRHSASCTRDTGLRRELIREREDAVWRSLNLGCRPITAAVETELQSLFA